MSDMDIPCIHLIQMAVLIVRVAVIGSRGLSLHHIADYLPKGTTQIISGGAKGVDACVKSYAMLHGIPYLEFLPDYRRYRKGAPIRRNLQIAENADLVIALWDGKSHGTKNMIDLCRKLGVPVRVHILPENTLPCRT